MMKTRWILLISSLFLVTVVGLLWRHSPAAEAQETRTFLQKALADIPVPSEGVVLHETTLIYNRIPPRALEPADPYHKPYELVWGEYQREETWLQIGKDRLVTSWRTMGYDVNGNLLQDLLFENGIETDYMVETDYVSRFAQKAFPYRESRVALIEDFLQQERLMRRTVADPDGRTVIGVYGAKAPLPAQSVEEALAHLNRPFVADLHPVFQAVRVDFDPVSLLPVGQARVVWDEQDAEHIISYRFFVVSSEVVPAEQVDTVFRQEIPEQLRQSATSLSVATITYATPEQAARQTSYPVYALDTAATALKLEAIASATQGQQGRSIPQVLQGIEFAHIRGLGLQMIYAGNDGNLRLTVTQGPTISLQQAFQQTIPVWIRSSEESVKFASQTLNAWELITTDPKVVKFVVETGPTLLYIEAQGMTHEQVTALLPSFALVK